MMDEAPEERPVVLANRSNGFYDLPCGCKVFLDHKDGDRRQKCEHDVYAVRAVAVTKIHYEARSVK